MVDELDIKRIERMLSEHQTPEQRAYHALLQLESEHGPKSWLRAAILALDALQNNPGGIDEFGRALDADGKPYPWVDDYPTVQPAKNKSADITQAVFVFAHQRQQPVNHQVCTCEVCGTEFVVTAWPGMNTPRFCSDKCRRAHRAAYMRTYRARKKPGE